MQPFLLRKYIKMYKSIMMICFMNIGIIMHATNDSIKSKDVAVEQLKHPINVRYTNWRGETAVRSIVPLEIYFGKTDYHPEEQWLLRVWDVERDAERIYAFKDIKEILG